MNQPRHVTGPTLSNWHIPHSGNEDNGDAYDEDDDENIDEDDEEENGEDSGNDLNSDQEIPKEDQLTSMFQLYFQKTIFSITYNLSSIQLLINLLF